MIDYSQRLSAAQARMAGQGIDLMFLPHSANLHYVTGIARQEGNYGNTIYPGDWMTGAWIAPGRPPILTVPRMLAEFHLSISGYDVRVLPDTGDPLALVRDVLAAFGIVGRAAVAVEDRARAETVLKLQMLLPEARFSSAWDVLGPLRRVKDAGEIAVLRQAGAITEAAYAATLGRLKHGMSTLDLITEVNYQLKKAGSLSPSFVTSFYNMGPNFAFNFQNGEEMMLAPLEPPVSISFDFGSVYDGYCYDFGRSVYFGQPDAEYRRAYGLVMAAQAAGIAALSPGRACEQADAMARAVIADAGYGTAFRHRLGHGIGMDVHEPPFLAAGNATPLEAGMCFTVEPSIFLPGRFGARVEDIVVVAPGGGQPLTSGFRALHIVD